MLTPTVCSEPGCPWPATHRGRCELHRQRRRPYSGHAWARIVARVVRRDRGICWLCGRTGADSADHIVRVRDGGSDDLANLRAAHWSCNRERG
jgi:5-methylcytosine-specific restriction endonuclease McrA